MPQSKVQISQFQIIRVTLRVKKVLEKYSLDRKVVLLFVDTLTRTKALKSTAA